MDLVDAILKGNSPRTASAAPRSCPLDRRETLNGGCFRRGCDKPGASTPPSTRSDGKEKAQAALGERRLQTLLNEQQRLRKVLRTFNRQGPLSPEAGRLLQQHLRQLSQIEEALCCLREKRPCSEAVEAALKSLLSETTPAASAAAPSAAGGVSSSSSSSTAQNKGRSLEAAREEEAQPKTPNEALLWQLRERQAELMLERKRSEEERARLATSGKAAVRRAAAVALFRVPVAGEAGSDPYFGGREKRLAPAPRRPTAASAFAVQRRVSASRLEEAFRRHQLPEPRKEPSLILHDCGSGRGDSKIPSFRLPRERPAEDARREGCLVGMALERVKARQVEEARLPPAETPTLIQQLDALKRRLKLDAPAAPCEPPEKAAPKLSALWRSLDGTCVFDKKIGERGSSAPSPLASNSGSAETAAAAPRFVLKETKPSPSEASGRATAPPASFASRRKKPTSSPVPPPSKANAAAGNKALLIERRRRQLLMRALLREKERMETQQQAQSQLRKTPVFEITPPQNLQALPSHHLAALSAKHPAGGGRDASSVEDAASLERRKRELEKWEQRLRQREESLLRRARAAQGSARQTPPSLRDGGSCASESLPGKRASQETRPFLAFSRPHFRPHERARLPCVSGRGKQGGASSRFPTSPVSPAAGRRARAAQPRGHSAERSFDEGASSDGGAAANHSPADSLEEEDSVQDSLDGFIANSSQDEAEAEEPLLEGTGLASREEEADWRSEIQRVTGYDPSDAKFRQRDRERLVESSFAFMDQEERRTRQVGAEEDRREWLLERAAEQRKKRRL